MFNPNEHLLNLKGKDYLQVMWRLVWFREDKPLWCIDTSAVSIDENGAVFVAKIMDENGIQKASGYGSETKRDFGDYIEKAETKAIGRALAMMGYGTQFAPDLDEGERIVDSPIAQKIAEAKKQNPVYASRADLVEILKACGGDQLKAGKLVEEKGYTTQNLPKDVALAIISEQSGGNGPLPWEENTK